MHTYTYMYAHIYMHTHTGIFIDIHPYPLHAQMNPKKRAKEERDSKRASARDINERRATRTLFLASTAAPACSSASTVFVCPFRADMKRGVLSSCCRGGVRSESCCGRAHMRTCIHMDACLHVCM